ncbi:MAG: PIN domain-containing protein [Deltaproteobacteria bacterium]|nr:PIN domain-containing protein [Deltaproteobacteria bacterium]
MSELIVDTSVWIDFFSGKTLPELEQALKDGRVLLSPIVRAELLSGTMTTAKEKQLVDFLEDLNFHETTEAHWTAVGRARRLFREKGLRVSVPDAHVAQCALETNGLLYSFDTIFSKIAQIVPIRILK